MNNDSVNPEKMSRDSIDLSSVLISELIEETLENNADTQQNKREITTETRYCVKHYTEEEYAEYIKNKKIKDAKKQSCCYKCCDCCCYEKKDKENNDCSDNMFWYWYWYCYFRNNDDTQTNTSNNIDNDCICFNCGLHDNCCHCSCDDFGGCDCDCDD